MELNLLPILNCDGKRMPIDASIKLTQSDNDEFQILGEVLLKGEVANIGGSLELAAKGYAKLERICDRCVEPYVFEINFPVEERMKKIDTEDVSEDSDVLLIEGSSIDLAELTYTGLCLNIPSKSLCDEECKGLCPICGGNRNKQSCKCDDRPTDPRFDVLDQLL